MIAAALTFDPARAVAAGGTLVSLGDLAGGSVNSEANDVSADGNTVVGFSQSANGQEAFRWTSAEGMVGLGGLSGGDFLSVAYAVSADGSVVVGSGANDSYFPDDPVAFRWTNGGGMVELQSDWVTNARAVASDGTDAVGDLCCDPVDGQEAVLWHTEHTLVTPGDGGAWASGATGISDDGTIVGFRQSTSSAGNEAWVWTVSGPVEGLGDLSGGGTESRAIAITPDGAVVVGFGHGISGIEAFRWTRETGIVGLGDVPGGGFHSLASDLSADGAAVVGVGLGASGYRAAVWDVENGMRDLAEVLTGLGVDLEGWTLFEATGISDDARVIVGAGGKTGEGGAWMVVLDEPIAVAPASTPVPSSSPVGAAVLIAVLCATARGVRGAPGRCRRGPSTRCNRAPQAP